MKNSQSSLRARLKSFGFAINGLRFLFKSEKNAQIHLIVGSLAIISGMALCLSGTSWGLLASAITLVLVSEAFNTAIEVFADALHPEQNEKIGKVKDLCAGAVLLSAIYAVIIGFVVFGPHLISLLETILSSSPH